MSRADVSVIITNFNKPPEQITECVESVRAQTVPPKEIFFIDDCSNPAAANGFCTSILLPKNVGVAKARDIGVKMSTGRLLLFIDADDKLAPDYIQQSGKVIANRDIAYPNILMFGAVERNEFVETPAVLKPKDLLGRTNKVLVSSMMHRRVYESLGGFRQLPIFEDWDFWIRAMCKGYTFGRANTLYYYRQNPQSRNHAPLSVRSAIIDQITEPYEIVNGKVQERGNHERQTVKTS